MMNSTNILRQTLFVVLLVFISTTGLAIAANSAGAASTIMQCMEKCIKDEGKDQKATCKQRCANVPSVFDGKSQAGGMDCMAIYKSCNSTCKKGKDCLRKCKQSLMKCK